MPNCTPNKFGGSRGENQLETDFVSSIIEFDCPPNLFGG